MPRIRLHLEDDQGNPILASRRTYQLEGGCETLEEIERAVESFKRQALPEIEHSLLEEAQERFVERGKKQDLLRLNGKDRVRMKTLHGSFEFKEQRFVLADGSCGRYLRHTGQGRISCGLRELCLYYSNRLSFAEVGKLLERLSGERLLCKQTLCNWVRQKAGELSAALRSEVAATEELAIPAFSEKADIYDEKAEEVLVMTDAIQVKAQKGTHQSSEGGACVDGHKHNKKVKRISTEMMLLESRDGSFRHLCGGLDETVNLQELARSHLRREWVPNAGPLPMVAITDGARSLRLMLEELFGASVRVIL